MKTTAQKLAELIEGHFGCDPVTEANLSDPEFLGELQPDSLDMVELVMSIEEQFGVAISDDEADPYRPNDFGTTKPLSELVTLIDSKKLDQAA